MKVNPIAVLVAIILFCAIVFFLYINMPKANNQIEMNITERQAILNDAMTKYPDADRVDIVNTTEIIESGIKYLNVKVRVTENFNSTCPKRYHLEYFYPQQKFEPSKPELVTKDCKLCEDGTCIIAFEEEAIIASTNAPGAIDVKTFVTSNSDAVPSVTSLEDSSWKVTWKAGDKSIEVTLSNRGAVLAVTQ